MKREIKDIKPAKSLDSCCPGHDQWPDDTYRNNRSKRARARDKAKEHRFVRRILKIILLKSLDNGLS